MPNTKLNFISRLYVVEQQLGPSLYKVLLQEAYLEDWDFVKQIIGTVIDRLGEFTTDEDSLQLTLDHLYSLIPGQDADIVIRLKGARG